MNDNKFVVFFYLFSLNLVTFHQKRVTMARIPRLVNRSVETIYHVVSRSAVGGFPMEEVEKDKFLDLLKELSWLYFIEVLGFCIMSNHFHCAVKMKTEKDYSDAEMRLRWDKFYQGSKVFRSEHIPSYRERFSDISQFSKDLKQSFTRFYNNKFNRKGYF